MTQFVFYPGLDDGQNFPPEIREKIAQSPEVTQAIQEGTSSISDVAQSSQSKLARLFPPFDLNKCNIVYRNKVGGGNRLIYQGMHVIESMGNILYASYYDTTTDPAGNESAHYVKLHRSGAILEEMIIVGGGHGTGFFVENDGGTVYLWTRANDISGSTPVPHRARIPWQAGTFQFSNIQQYVQTAFDGRDHVLAFDEYNGIVSDRAGAGTTASPYILKVFTLADVKAGNLNNPLHSTTVVPSLQGLQSSTYIHEAGHWLLAYGPPNATSNQLLTIDASSGAQVAIRTVDEDFNYNQWGALTSEHELEALFVHHTPAGVPVVYLSCAYGHQYGRVNTLYTLDMGFVDDVFSNLGDYQGPNYSGWNLTGFTPNGTTSDSTRPFKFRFEDDRLRLKGRLNGTFQAGTNNLGTLNAAIFPPYAVQSLATKSAVTGSPDGVVRVELTSSGVLNAYLPLTDTASVSWLDFDMTLFNMNFDDV